MRLTARPLPLVLFLCAVFIVVSDGILSAELIVFPRLITPGSPPENERAFFCFTNFDDPKPELKIYDIAGRAVRSLTVANPDATSSGWQTMWDGTDDNGSRVPSGVYIYQWNQKGAVSTGTIIVAR